MKMWPDKMACFYSMNWPRNTSQAHAVLSMLKWISSKCHCLDFVRCRNVSTIVVAADATVADKNEIRLPNNVKSISFVLFASERNTNITFFFAPIWHRLHWSNTPATAPNCAHILFNGCTCLFRSFLSMRCVCLCNSFFYLLHSIKS